MSPTSFTPRLPGSRPASRSSIRKLHSSTPTPSTSDSNSKTLMSSSEDPVPVTYTTPPPPQKSRRRSSYEVLHGIAGPDSNLPLPKRMDDPLDVNGTNDVIREGIPMSFGSPSNPMASKRPSSPTRSLSRIPVSAVGNARALADDGQHHHHSFSSPGVTPVRQGRLSISKSHSATDLSLSTPTIVTAGSTTAPPDSSSFSTLVPPSPTPNGAGSFSLNPNSPSPQQTRRISSTPGGTTKVLADLQAGVINARNALENTKSQLRLSQRTVASLTRKVEDLKEVEDRLRIENEGLNNVVARKERLLQEVLERARKAEAEATTLKQQLKHETTTNKKTFREMESQLAESTALSKKSEREYITLRDSLKSMSETWKHDTESLKSEMRKREDKWRKEVDGIGKKYRDLCGSVNERERIWEEEYTKVREEDRKAMQGVEKVWMQEMDRMKGIVEKSGRDCDKAEKIAQDLALELAILKKRMQSVRRFSSTTEDESQPAPDTEQTPNQTTISNTMTHATSSRTTHQDNAPP